MNENTRTKELENLFSFLSFFYTFFFITTFFLNTSGSFHTFLMQPSLLVRHIKSIQLSKRSFTYQKWQLFQPNTYLLWQSFLFVRYTKVSNFSRVTSHFIRKTMCKTSIVQQTIFFYTKNSFFICNKVPKMYSISEKSKLDP